MIETSPAEWDADGILRSRATGDIYFSKTDGLAESRAVFLAGCDLPNAWRGRRQFTVGEIGFGTGLNIAALLHLWQTAGPAEARLSIFSIEAAPLPAEDARRALSRWPELAPVAELLLARWPGRATGIHRVDLPELRATLDVAVMDAGAALEEWQGAADAWFLDGFSPALNPDAWRPQVLQAVGHRSRPGARAATFTVAGAVRRGLEAAGFAASRQPGFGNKRQRLEAVRPDAFIEPSASGPVAIVGAGIAGAALARALRAAGHEVRVFDVKGAGAGASGNLAALVGPRLDAGFGPSARLSARAFARAIALYAQLAHVVTGHGMLQLEQGPRDQRRFAAIAASDLFEPEALGLLSAGEAATLTGDEAAPGLLVRPALAIEPGKVLAAWLGDVEAGGVAAIEPGPQGWRLLDADGQTIAEAGVVCLTNGWGLAGLAPALPLAPIRGQMSIAERIELPVGVGWGGYAAPGRDIVVFGATYDRGETGVDARAEDDRRNLENLARGLPRLAAALADRPLTGRASIRAVTPDREPVAGALPGHAGVFVLGALGSRGFTNAPLLAEHVAALITGAPSPLAGSQAAVVDPARF